MKKDKKILIASQLDSTIQAYTGVHQFIDAKTQKSKPVIRISYDDLLSIAINIFFYGYGFTDKD